jgi:hypothetical protein
VRLTAKRRAEWLDIGEAIGVVHGQDREVVEVQWPDFRSWQLHADIEPVP